MPSFKRLLVVLALGVALHGAPAGAQDIRIIPIPPKVKPQWTPVPGAPQVYYAPNIPTDVFKHRGRYYFYWEGSLFSSRKPSGPWKAVSEAPEFFSRIGPEYFKTLRKEEPASKPPAEPEAAPPAETAPASPPGTAKPESQAPEPEAAPQVPEPEEAPGEPGKPPPKVM